MLNGDAFRGNSGRLSGAENIKCILQTTSYGSVHFSRAFFEEERDSLLRRLQFEKNGLLLAKIDLASFQLWMSRKVK
jgi:hypothetical protein